MEPGLSQCDGNTHGMKVLNSQGQKKVMHCCFSKVCESGLALGKFEWGFSNMLGTGYFELGIQGHHSEFQIGM